MVLSKCIRTVFYTVIGFGTCALLSACFIAVVYGAGCLLDFLGANLATFLESNGYGPDRPVPVKVMGVLALILILLFCSMIKPMVSLGRDVTHCFKF